MAESTELMTIDNISNRVYVIRGQQVMLDYDLAGLYGYEVKALNQQVKRNIDRFPEDFMFQLKKEEVPTEFSKSQFVTLNENGDKRGTNIKKMPYAFTEQGIYMLATVLRGKLAEQQSIFIMRAFREMRHYIKQNQQFVTQSEMRLVTAKVSEISAQVAGVVDWKNKAEEKFDGIQRSIDLLNENFVSEKDFKNFVIYKGQKFEADAAYIDIYQQAEKSIYVIDDYVNTKTLQLLSQKQVGVEVVLFTENGHGKRGFLTTAVVNDFMQEYPSLRIKPNADCHDRLIVLDYGLSTEQVYHCGASSKDAGKKLCAINIILETSMIHPVMHDYAITAIEDLDKDVKYQVLSYKALESDVIFPDSLEVTAEYTTYEQVSENGFTENTVSDNTKIKTETKNITINDITWKLDKDQSDFDVFTSSEEELEDCGGAYFVYTADIPKKDKDGNTYTLAEGIALPEIEVMVGDATAGIMTLSSGEMLDVSDLETRSISFGFGYSDYIVIDSENVSDFDGKTLTGTTTNGIFISDGVTVNLTIEDLNITKSEDISSCISVGYDATLNLTVKGNNTLTATGWGGAGIEVMGQHKATLRITSDSTGTLTANGGYGSKQYGNFGGAGIGGMARIATDINQIYVGNIIIEGGTINATGGYQAAGIGGTIGASGGNITITGGTVTATGDSGGAGIGGGFNGNVDSITISGGIVTANAGDHAAAIGAGKDTSLDQAYVLPFNTIRITGGTVTANGNIGYGKIVYRDTPADPGTIEISEDVNFTLNGEITLGSSDTTSSGKYTLHFTIHDGRLTKDTTAKITYSDDNKIITDNARVSLLQNGKAGGSASFITTSSLAGEQTFIFTIDGRTYTKTVTIDNSSSKIDMEIGTPLYPVTLEFYGAAISEDLDISSITVKQDGKELSADNGEFYAPLAISYNRYGYGIMLCYLPQNSDSTEISVTAVGLNDGNAMTVSDQTVSADSDNTITMFTTTDILLAVTAEVYGDSAIIHAETNKKDKSLCLHYTSSDVPITTVEEFKNIKASDRKNADISNGSVDITIDNLEENKTYEYYFMVSPITFLNDKSSNIVHLTLTTSAVAEVIKTDGTSEKYTTFDAAVEAAANETGCTVKLIKDAKTSGGVVLNGDFTLDLNGKTLKTTSEYQYYTLEIKGKITIKDSAGGGKITGFTIDGLIHGSEGASLTILSGIFEYTGTVTSAPAPLCWGDKADLSVQGGMFKSTKYSMEILDLSQDELSASRIGLSGGRFCNGILQSTNGYATAGQLLSPGYAYQYMSGDNAGKLTTGDISKTDDVEIVPASLQGSLIATADTVSVGDTITATFAVDTGKWVNSSAIGNYTYTWYRVGENEDTVIQTKAATTDTTDTYKLTEDDIHSQIYCVVTAEKCGGNVTSNEITVPGLSISEAKVTLSEENLSYNGKEQTPTVNVELNGKTLTEDNDYKVTYINNKNIGTATVYITGNGKYEGAVSKEFTITKRSVTVSGITAREKIYDGTSKAKLNFDQMKLDGVLAGDNLTVSAEGTFSDADAGENKTVTITGLTLSGTDMENYMLAESGQQTTTSATIRQKSVILEWSDNTAFTYNGSKQSVTATVSNAVGNDSFALLYENNGTIKNTATEVGNYTAKVISLGNDNYILDGATDISKEWSISYVTADDATLSGTKGDNGWYTGAVTLTAPAGYTISNDKNTWQDTLTINVEGTSTVRYYLKDKNGGITDAKMVEIRIDSVNPTGEIKIKDNSFRSLLNTITFGYFFKETVSVSITGADKTSGVGTIEYQKTAGTDSYDANGTWIDGSSFTVAPSEKFTVYARITDNAGNRTIINSEGVVVYEDVAAASSTSFTKTSTKDLDAGLTLNGNTVADIIKDGASLAAGSYTVADDRLIFKADYLNTLAAGTYTMTVSYNPLGEIYENGTSAGDAPQTSVITLTVKKADLTVSAVPVTTSATYSPSASLDNNFTLTGGSVKAAVDGVEKTVEGIWSWQDGDLTPTVRNDGYTAVFTPADSANFNSVTATVSVTITKAVPVIIEVPKASEITYGQPLSDSILSGGRADIEGRFQWQDENKRPTYLYDSERTEFIIVFYPTDLINYETATCKTVVKVNQAENAPLMPANSMIADHNATTVGEVTLPECWIWSSEDAGKTLNAGETVTATAIFNLYNKGNYKNETVQVSITRPAHILMAITKKDASCTENGNTAYWTCALCSRYFSDENGTTETPTGSWIIPATGHTLYKEPVAYIQPDAQKNGSVTYQCQVCDETISIEIPATTIIVPDTLEQLTDVGLSVSGWTWETQEKLLPGTIVTAIATYKVTEDLTITDTIQIKVSCSATNGSYQLGSNDAATIRCTGVLSAFHGLLVDGKPLTQGQEYTAASGSTIITFTADYFNTLSAGKHTVVMTYASGDVEAELLITKAGDVPKNDETKNDETKIEPQPDNTGSASATGETTSSGNGALPATGDDTPVLLWLLLFTASVGMLIVVIRKYKNIK